MRRTHCGGCTGTDLMEVLDLGDSPLANNFPASSQEAGAQRRYPLGLARCHQCTLIQLTEIVPDEELWEKDYGFYTGGSWIAAQHQEKYAKWVMGYYPGLCSMGVLEIACNDGTMLKHFQDAGYSTLGIDPAAGPVAKAREIGLDVLQEGFGSAAALRIVARYGHRGIVIANNVIAHVADLNDFVEGINIVLHPDGVAIVEFQYVVDLILGNQVDHLYHEHRQFFSLASIDYVLRQHGLSSLAVQQNHSQGGSLRLVIGKRGLRQGNVAKLLRQERWLGRTHCLEGLQGRADRMRHRLRSMLLELWKEEKRVAGYGASAKSATMLNWCNLGPDLIQYVVDATPSKHGRYTPGTGIPIISPSADSRVPDVYVMFVWNYLPEVMKQETLFQTLGGRWLVPIPAPVLL